MYQSWFTYAVTRPYPFRWFTPVTIMGGIVLVVLVSLANLSASGYFLKTVYTTDPNGTVASASQWFLKPPFNWDTNFAATCQPHMLSVGDKFFTSNLGLRYEITAITQKDGNTPLSSTPYYNNTLEDCYLAWSRLHLTKADSKPAPNWWMSWVDSQQSAKAELHHSGHCVVGYRTFKSLLLGLFDLLSQIDDWKDAYPQYGSMYISRNTTVQNITSDDFLYLSYHIVISDGSVIVGPPGDKPLFKFQAEARHYTKIVQSLVSSDLGNCDSPNILLDNESLRYAILDPKNTNRNKGGMLYGTARLMKDPGRAVLLQKPDSKEKVTFEEAYDEITPLTGELGCQKATVMVQYMCSVPVQKNGGTMLVSLLLANLVFLGGAWKLLNVIAGAVLLRQGPEVDFCKGCQRVVCHEYVEMGHARGEAVPEETTATSVSSDNIMLLPK